MAISFVGSASAQTGTGAPSTTSIIATLPTGIQSGDFIILAVNRSLNYPIAATPTGWTWLENVIDSGTAPSAATTDVYYRLATGTETTTGPTFSTATATRFITTAAVYRGVDSTSPFIDHGGQVTTSTTANRVGPALTNTNVNAWGVYLTNIRNVATPVTFTPPAGLTERLLVDIGGSTNTGVNSNMACEWADTAGPAGSTGSITYTGTSSPTTTIGIVWAAFLTVATATGGGFGTSAFGISAFGGTGGVPATVTGSVSALGAGGAAVSGFGVSADAPTAGGVGAATVTGRVTTFGITVAAGVGGATVVGTGGTATISFVGAAVAQTPAETAPSTSSLGAVLPSGITADDLILVAVHRQQDYPIVATPTGYTLLDHVLDSGTSPAAADTDIYYRFADGSETTAGPTFSTASPARFIIHAAVYRGVDKAATFIAHGGQDTAGVSTASRVAPTLSNTNTRAWGVFAAAGKNITTPSSFTPPPGLIDRLDSDIGAVDTGTSTGNLSAEWADTAAQIGSTGSITYTSTSSAATANATAWAAFLKPTTGGVVQSGSVTAIAAGHATVTGFVSPSGVEAAAGVGSATVTARMTASVVAVAVGAGSVAVTAVVTKSTVLHPAGAGGATVSAAREQLFGVTAAGVGGGSLTGSVVIVLPPAGVTAVAAAGVGAAVVAGVVGIVVPPHIVVTATLVSNGLSDATLLAVPLGVATLADLGELPDADVTSDGMSTATVLPVAPGDATVQTT